jgi:hypothetical protein
MPIFDKNYLIYSPRCKDGSQDIIECFSRRVCKFSATKFRENNATFSVLSGYGEYLFPKNPNIRTSDEFRARKVARVSAALPQRLWQLRDIRRNPPRLVARE